jgi:hypothetical protein avisC_03301
MSDTSIPEDDTVTDDVSTPATEDTDTTEPATDRKFAFLSRHTSTLRALRLGGVFTVLAAIVLAIVWWVQLTLLWRGVPPYFRFTLAIVFLWFVGVRLRPLKRTLAAITAVCTIVAVGFMGQYWWLIHEQSSIWIVLPSVQALATLGLGIFVASDVALRGVRDHQNTPPGDPDDPARYRPMKHNPTSSRRWTGLLRRAALALVPVTAAATAIALIQASTAPINHTAPLPEGPLPERSTGIGTTLAWTRDVPGLLATASGAAGPVILTPEGLTGLNPTDGTTLWTYHRTNATYAKMLGVESGQGSFGNLSGSYLVSSPNGRYVALRIMLPYELAQFHTNDAATVVVDTLTGHATSEHLSSSRRHLQLTDSAILDGTTAYNLDDGKVRWSLKPLTDNSRLYPASGYSGPAGHRSFILSGKFNEDRPEHRSKSLTLMSDADPANTTTVENIAIDILTGYPVIVGGRTAQYTKALVVEREKGEDSRAVQAQETRVVTLDSLAGLEEIKPIDMGKTIGLNGAASHASGTLAAYPIPEDGKIKFRYSGKSVEHLEWGKPTVGTVFDPTTNTTTPANQYPGLAAATVGIAPAAQGDTLSAEIVMKPGDGSTGASIPLDLRTMLLFPLEELKLSTPSLLPSQLPRHIGGEAVNFFNTPESTLVTLKIDDKKLLDSLDWYSLYSPPTGTGYEYAPSYRLYGLTGDAS